MLDTLNEAAMDFEQVKKTLDDANEKLYGKRFYGTEKHPDEDWRSDPLEALAWYQIDKERAQKKIDEIVSFIDDEFHDDHGYPHEREDCEICRRYYQVMGVVDEYKEIDT